jgi:hypothetical protein
MAMNVILLETGAYIHPPFPVECLITADGVAIRIAIEWSAIERLMGTSSVDERSVRDFLHKNRREIALAIEAHLVAQGVPLSRKLVMSSNDFDVIDRIQQLSATDSLGASDNRLIDKHAERLRR